MFNSSQPTQSQGGLIGAFAALATPLALGATVFIAPSVWPIIDAPVTSKLSELYGWSAAYWLDWDIHILTYPITFSLIRVGLIGSLTALSAFTMNRLT